MRKCGLAADRNPDACEAHLFVAQHEESEAAGTQCTGESCHPAAQPSWTRPVVERHAAAYKTSLIHQYLALGEYPLPSMVYIQYIHAKCAEHCCGYFRLS